MVYQQRIFNLPEVMLEQLAEFKKQQDAKVLTRQVEAALAYLNANPKENHLDSNWRWAKGVLESASLNEPYLGCSGGGYSYEFTPTTVGTLIKITNYVNKESMQYFWES